MWRPSGTCTRDGPLPASRSAPTITSSATPAALSSTRGPIRWDAVGYQAVTRFYLTTGQPIGQRFSDLLMDYLVGFAQRADTPAERLVAWNLLVGDIKVPVPPQRLAAIPTYPDAANHLTRSLFTRLVPDAARPVPRTWNGIPVPLPPLDPVVGGLLRDELRGNLLNLDGFPFVSHPAVVGGLPEDLADAGGVQCPARGPGGAGTPARAAAAAGPAGAGRDLSAHIQQAVTPYFNQ